MTGKEKLNLESMKDCPRCGNETSGEILGEIGGCYFCGNTDFSEEAYLLRDDSRKLNCSLCGRLITLTEVSSYNPLFFKFSKRMDVGPFEFFKKMKIDVRPFDWVKLCPKCVSEIKIKQDFTIIKKILSFHGKERK